MHMHVLLKMHFSIYAATHHIEIDPVAYIQVRKKVNMITDECAFTNGCEGYPLYETADALKRSFRFFAQ